MSDSISRAFDHPLARSVALSGEVPLDRISLRDHVREVEIGAFQAERGTTQRLRFNVVVEVVALDEPVDDDVDRILSYDRVTEAIGAELAAERLNLLETLAERVALRILHEPQAMRVFVRIEKLDRKADVLGRVVITIGDHRTVLRCRHVDAGNFSQRFQSGLDRVSHSGCFDLTRRGIQRQNADINRGGGLSLILQLKRSRISAV